MQFTNAYQGKASVERLSHTDILRALRLDAAAELDAINLYSMHIEAIPDRHVQAVIARIRDDEKEHVAQFIALLAEMDPAQSGKIDDARAGIETQGARLLDYPNITEQVDDLSRRVVAFDRRMR